MPTYAGQRDQELARRVRRMLIEQSCVMQDDTPDEFTWLTKHHTSEQRFFEDELGARLELRLGRWARVYWPTPPRQRELVIADVFDLTARKQTAYACLIRAYRSVRLLEAGESASSFRFAELFRYVADEGQRQSPWLSFDETVINEALANHLEGENDEDDDLLDLSASATARPRKRTKAGAVAESAGATKPSARKASAAAKGAGSAAQRVRANQRAFYQAFAAFERYRLLRRLGADERQRPEERYRLDERDYSGVYEFTDLIDRFLPPAGLVQYDELNVEGGER
ncbi:MAG TPA: hypothetical protein VGR57_03550 [Ktedonobacterales bacterium]|nr:hypothetical protein [Ktedonobacterales bacterium]